MLPGFISAASGQGAAPVDRVFMCYSLLNNIQTTQGATVPINGGSGATVVNSRVSGFSVNMFNVGVEKTFFDNRASLYIVVPYLSATGNVTDQGINGLGDVSIGAKFVLLRDECSGSLLTGGFTYYAPTAKVTTIPSAVGINGGGSGENIFGPLGHVQTLNTLEVNTTFLQPYVAALLQQDKFWVNEYLGLIIPTDGSVSTFINNDITVGYRVYKACNGSMLSSVTATLDFQALIPVNHTGTPASGDATQSSSLNTPLASPSIGFSDWFFVTPGVQIGIGDRAALSAGFVVPVGGPRAYQYGVQCGLTFYY